MRSPQDMKIVMIEITNACVHTCSNCTRFCGHHRKPFFMDYETFTAAVDSMKGFKGIVGIMGGEPTIHPQFGKYVEYFRSHFGVDDPSKTLREPTKDFVGYIVRNVFNIDHNNQRGLWSSVGPKYAEHFESIQDTFGYQALNDHTNPSMHEALMVTRKELGIPDEKWITMRDACWIQNIWSASITPKGAFFCEVAAALDMLLDGPGGWPIEPGWWKRKPKDFESQLHWCELCSAPLAMPSRDAREGIDDVSPLWHEKLKAIGSPKLNKGRVKKFDVSGYNAANHRVINESLPYLHDQSLRIGESNKALYPPRIAAMLRLSSGMDEETARRMVSESCLNAEVAAVISENPAHEDAARRAQVAFLNSAGKSGEAVFEELKELLAADDWVLLLNEAAASKTVVKCIRSLVFNPGCLYCGPERDSAETSRVPAFMLFNLRAAALRESADLSDLRGAYSAAKIVPLDVDLNLKVKIYLSYHDDTVRIQNDILTPVQVGNSLSDKDLGMIGDDTGENISDKNPMYAELTAQYWAWKNDRDSDYLGCMHYRRVFAFNENIRNEVEIKSERIEVPTILPSDAAKYGWSEAAIIEGLDGYDIVLPLPCKYKGGPWRNSAECFMEHGVEHYRLFRELIAKYLPEYCDDAEESFADDRAYLCNMFVMRRELFDRYSAWLFGALDKFMPHLTPDSYDSQQIRMPAFMAERLLNLYLRKLVRDNPGLRVKEVPYVFIENPSPAAKPIAAVKSAKQVVPVVTAFDGHYAPYFGTFLSSMLDNISEERHYDVIVLEDGVTDEHKMLFDAMIKGRPNVGIRYINMAGAFEDKNATHVHFTKSTFNRLKIPELLPEYGKVVYIDPDTVLLRDLADLFDRDIASHYAGAALDYTFKYMTNSGVRVGYQFGGTTVKEYLFTYLELSERAAAGYFNAGVMLFNLDQIRKDGLATVFERLFRLKPYCCVDQDILNKAFDGNVLHIDPRWNIITQPLSEMKKMPHSYYKEFAAARRDPFVLHFAGQSKPWKNPQMDFAEFFWLYCRKTPFYEKILSGAFAANGAAFGAGPAGGEIAKNGNRHALAHYSRVLKTSASAMLHQISPSLHTHCRQFYHRIRQ
jgi:lipopolysaccharide biosynthesis glycosyltransferase